MSCRVQLKSCLLTKMLSSQSLIEANYLELSTINRQMPSESRKQLQLNKELYSAHTDKCNRVAPLKSYGVVMFMLCLLLCLCSDFVSGDTPNNNNNLKIMFFFCGMCFNCCIVRISFARRSTPLKSLLNFKTQLQ